MTVYAPPSIDPRSWTLLSDIDREADEACRRDLESALLPEERVYLLGESPGGTINRVTFGPTAWRFLKTEDAEVLVLYSSRREGKTVAAIARLIYLAQRRAKPLRAVVVRDTWTNLKRTVIATIQEGVARGWWDADFREAETECLLNGGAVHLLLIGMDRPADASKFQGLGLGCVWIEEPAPAADLASGVPVDVFAMAVTSLSQEDGPVTPSVMLTMNPPDEDHWTVQIVDQLISRRDPRMRVKTFRIPKGENRHVSDAYRERMRIGLEIANRGDLVRRLADGFLGSVKVGEPVTPEFNEERHVAREALEVRRNFPTFRFFDLWHSPAIVWAQQTPLGYLHVLGCIQGENMGVEELTATHVIPWERQYGLTAPRSLDPFSGGPLTSWTRERPIRTIIDPSGKAGDQSSTERSAAKVIEKMLGTTCEYGPVAWSARRDSVKALLARTIRGRPQVVIDPEALPLIRALRGGWRYPKTSSGTIGRLPIKDIFCVDEATEILTARGWRSWHHIKPGGLVFAYSVETNRFAVVPLRAVHVSETPGHAIVRLGEMVVTPSHRCVVFDPMRPESPFSFILASDLLLSSDRASRDGLVIPTPHVDDRNASAVTISHGRNVGRNIADIAYASEHAAACIGFTVGRVWCPETELGTWVARRGNFVFVTGNSHSGDAFAYGAAVLYPVEEQVRAAIRTPVPTVMEHVTRARSFMGV